MTTLLATHHASPGASTTSHRESAGIPLHQSITSTSSHTVAGHGASAAVSPGSSVRPSAVGGNVTSTSVAQPVLAVSAGRVDFEAQLDFLSANRVVAVLEKALERLQLLHLLDATAPPITTTKGATTRQPGVTGLAYSSSSAATVAASMGGTTAQLSTLQGSRTTGEPNGVPGGSGGMTWAPSSSSGPGGGTTVTPQELARLSLLQQQQLGASKARAAATFDGPLGQSLRSTVPAVTEALQRTANVPRRGRPTVAHMMAEQQALEARYGELLRATQTTRPPATEPVLDAHCFALHRDDEAERLQRELKVVSTKLRDHSKALCTQLKDNPDDADNWAKISNERRELMGLLQTAIAELTTGYQEARRDRTDASMVGSETSARYAAGSVAGSTGPTGIMAASATNGLQRSVSGRSLLSTHASDGGSPSQSQTPSLMKRFGSFAQIKRAAKNNSPQPRIPLLSSYEQFARRVLQEQAAQRWADELVQKERELNQNVKQLQSDLIQEQGLREKELAERQARIAELRVQLRERKRRLKERSDETKAQSTAAAEALQRAAAEDDREVNEAASTAERLLRDEDRAYALFAEHLKQRAAEMETLAAEWDRKNQSEIMKMEMQKLDAEQTRQQCAERLVECERDMTTQTELKQERDAAKQAEEEEAIALETRHHEEYEAASQLQSALKAMLTRQALAKLKKASKKKKKAAAA